jgi:hypothetical protein
MAFLDHEGGAEFPYHREDVLEALANAIQGLPGMEVDSVDKFSGRVVAKAGMSLMSWGETIPISVAEVSPGRTRVSVTSTPKTGLLFGGAFDGGKNRRNVEAIISALSDELSTKPPADVHPPAPGNNDQSARLTKLKRLFEEGLITEDEYNTRKKEILAEI